MRGLGLVGVLLAFLLVGMLVKKQLTQLPVSAAEADQTSATGNSQPTPAQLHSKIQDDLKAAMQPARTASDE